MYYLWFKHRDKPRVCTPAKMFSHLKLIYFIISVYGPHSYFWHKAKKQFLDVFFYNKSKILSILFIVKYEKNHTFWSVFSVVGAHILPVQMRKRNRNKTIKHAHSTLISMSHSHPTTIEKCCNNIDARTCSRSNQDQIWSKRSIECYKIG